MLGLRFCTRAFSSCGKREPLFIAVHGPLTIAASLVAEHRLQTRRLSSCGSRTSLLRGMWNLPRPGLEPVSPALAGRFSTTAPPGKPRNNLLREALWYLFSIQGSWGSERLSNLPSVSQLTSGGSHSCVSLMLILYLWPHHLFSLPWTKTLLESGFLWDQPCPVRQVLYHLFEENINWLFANLK